MFKRDVLSTTVYTVVPSYVRRRVFERERVVCASPDCNRPSTAPMPPMPCERALYDCRFVAWLVVMKFGLLVPLDRIRTLLLSQGVDIAMGTLVRLIERAADLAGPIDGEHYRQLRAGAFLHFDGTGLKTLVVENQCDRLALELWGRLLPIPGHRRLLVPAIDVVRGPGVWSGSPAQSEVETTVSYKVQNVEGTGGSSAPSVCGCPSWLAHWRRNTGSERVTCMSIGCRNDVEVGAHVQLRKGGIHYIAGLCNWCNNHHFKDRFEIDERSRLVPAKMLEGCGK